MREIIASNRESIKHIKKLVSQKLVERVTSKEDGRVIELKLGKKGALLLRDRPPLVQDRLVEGIARMAAHEREGLVAGLHSLIEKAGLQEAEPSLFFEEDAK